MNPHTRELKQGIAVVSAVKNRSDPLRYTIPGWLADPLVRQLILVDWSSDRPLHKTLDRMDIPGWPDPRTLIVRVVDQTYWQMGKAINLGMKFVTHTITFKVDADVALVEPLSNCLPIKGKSFFAGYWKGRQFKNANSLYGTAVFATRDFYNVNGFDERFERYGCEDTDLYDRLVQAKLERKRFTDSQLYHLPHSDTVRQVHQKFVHGTPEEAIQISDQIVRTRKRWSSDFAQTRFEIISTDSTHNRCIVKALDFQKTHAS